MPEYEVVLVDTNDVDIVETQTQGPPGVAGIAVVAGEGIAYGKVIRSDSSNAVFLADFENDVGEILGVAIGTASIGGEFLYLPLGKVTKPGALSGEVYYVGKNGDMTTTPPDHGLLRLIAECHRDGEITVVQTISIRRHVWP